jgi:hypothetical protein
LRHDLWDSYEFSTWWRRGAAMQLRATLLAWDPLGVTADRADWPEVFGTYDAYLRPLARVLATGGTTEDVEHFLTTVVTSLDVRTPVDVSRISATVATWYATKGPPPEGSWTKRWYDGSVQIRQPEKRHTVYRRRRRTADGVWRASGPLSDASWIWRVGRVGDRVSLDFHIVGHWLTIGPPSTYLETVEHASGVREHRWRSPVLGGTVLVRHVERYRRSRRGSDNVAMWVEEIDRRLRIRIGNTYVRVRAIDVTVEIRPDAVGTTRVFECLDADGLPTGLGNDQMELFPA